MSIINKLLGITRGKETQKNLFPHPNQCSSHSHTSSSTSQIVFIDSRVTDYQTLATGVISNTEVIILDSKCDGIKQITTVLSQKPNSTVHIVSHGSPGCLYLGNTQLSLDTLNQYASNLKTWFSKSPLLLGEGQGERLLLYGCNVAAGDAGEEFITKLHQITGAEIAASTTPIGNAAKGGNWELDVATQKTTDLAFTLATQATYSGVFAPGDLPWTANPHNNGILVRGAAFISCGTITANGLNSPVLAVDRVDVDADGNPVVPASGEAAVANPLTWSHQDWTQEKLGNVYGLDIDLQGNMYAAASANYGSGFGFPPNDTATAQINYGSIGGSLADGLGGNSADPTIEANELAAAGTIYKMDAVTGAPTVFAVLPQQSTTVTNIAAESDDPDIVRTNTGVGLGNIHHDKVHDQFFVSNFEDGRIYRLDNNGTILDSYDPGTLDTGSAGEVSISELVYGLTVSPDGSELFFSRNRTVYSIDLNTTNGSFTGSVNNSTNIAGSTWDNYAGATETSHDTVPEAGNIFGINLSSVVSDLDFLPTGELVVGTRVIANDTIFSSYNHNGRNYILEDTTTSGIYANRTEIVGFSTSTHFGGDDGYGGVSYSKKLDDSFDYTFSSSDIINEQGPHGIAIFPDDYTIEFVVNNNNTVDGDEIVPRGAISYGLDGDFKGVGGDVKVFNPGSIQGNVSQDTTGNGNGDTDLSDVILTLYDLTVTNPITDTNGNPITTTTDDDGNYVFDNLFPGDYTVVQTQPLGLVSLSENEGGADNDNPSEDNTVNNQISATVSVEENDLGNDFVEEARDFGDAPDTGAGNGPGNYTTIAAQGGPSHFIISGLSLGSLIDADDGTLQNVGATADDDDDGIDDEDGISSFNLLTTNASSYSVDVAVTNTTGGDVTLVGWIDFNGNGVFDSTEAATATVANNATSATLTWNTIPNDIQAGDTYARFRISSDPLLNESYSTGAASDGEVEDYQLTIHNSIEGNPYSEQISGTSGNDFITGGKGQDTLTGGGGDDIFYFNETSDGVDIITDFDSNGDLLDFRGIVSGELSSITFTANAFDDGYVKAVSFGSHTMIQVDFDASGDLIPKDVVLLENVDSTTINASDFIFS